MLRIETKGGSAVGTKFTDTETGEDVTHMLPVAFGATVTLGEIVTAECQLMVLETSVDVSKISIVTVHPVTKQIAPLAAIEFRDGWRIEFSEDGTPRMRQQTPTGA